MSDQPKSKIRRGEPTGEWTSETLACFFHDTYEMLARIFGYETRDDARDFNPESKNGRLMVTVCGAVLLRFNAALAAEQEKVQTYEGALTRIRHRHRNSQDSVTWIIAQDALAQVKEGK